jgi:hypothetical protein
MLAAEPADLFGGCQSAAHTVRRDWASFAVVVLCDRDMLLEALDG